MSDWLKQHLKTDHGISKSSEYIGEIVYGGIDGIVTTFAVVAGFAGAGATDALWQVWPLAVVLFGLANLFGDGVSMGLGAYLSTKSEQDIYTRERNKELKATTTHPEREHQETISLLTEQGMTDTDALAMTTLMKHYPELWIKRQMDNELWLADVRDSSPMIEWLITLGSFIVFGAIPLIPYLFFDNIDYRISSLIMTALALITLGVARRYVTKMNFIKTVGQMVILWAVAAGVAYWTGHLVMKFQ